MKFDLSEKTSRFQVCGEFMSGQAQKTGHINDTFIISCHDGQNTRRYVLQRINNNVFTDVDGLMDNISRVCNHISAKLEKLNGQGSAQRSLKPIPTVDGHVFHLDENQHYWRMYDFIENTVACDIVQNSKQAYKAAFAFGQFLDMMSDLPGPPLHETIKDFHNTPSRFKTFLEAVESDPLGRAEGVSKEIDFFRQRESAANSLHGKMLSGYLPQRPCHSDTKLNNLLLDPQTGDAVCVIDLDTLMPSLVSYDFGDLVRTFTSPELEDEPDCDRVYMRPEIFEALAEGFIAGAGGFLTPQELESLPQGGMVITYECGMRFLTDYLLGDKYFKIHREGHNLDRCRTQIRLVESMELQSDEISGFMDSLWAKKMGG